MKTLGFSSSFILTHSRETLVLQNWPTNWTWRVNQLWVESGPDAKRRGQDEPAITIVLTVFFSQVGQVTNSSYHQLYIASESGMHPGEIGLNVIVKNPCFQCLSGLVALFICTYVMLLTKWFVYVCTSLNICKRRQDWQGYSCSAWKRGFSFLCQVLTCAGVRLSTCLGEMEYMLSSTGVPFPYWLGESVGRVPEETVL